MARVRCTAEENLFMEIKESALFKYIINFADATLKTDRKAGAADAWHKMICKSFLVGSNLLGIPDGVGLPHGTIQ